MTLYVVLVVTAILGAATMLADALTPLGLLNFVVLQWLGMRLVRQRTALTTTTGAFRGVDVGLQIWTSSTDGKRRRWRIAGAISNGVTLERLGLQRWIWPLTGWWTEYRWIARRV